MILQKMKQDAEAYLRARDPTLVVNLKQHHALLLYSYAVNLVFARGRLDASVLVTPNAPSSPLFQLRTGTRPQRTRRPPANVAQSSRNHQQPYRSSP